MSIHKVRLLVGVVAGLVALGLWLAAVLARYPTWALVLLATVLILSFLAYARWADAKSSKEVDEADELTPWRRLRIIRSLQLRAESLETTTLLLELASESDPTTTAATLRFDGVSRLQVMQFGPYPIYFDGLRSERLAQTRSDGLAFRVRDVWNEMLQFYCASLEELPRDHSAQIG
ncbi:MAG: hypothetical protein U1E73_01625 [Planctomycetota bacterium]